MSVVTPKRATRAASEVAKTKAATNLPTTRKRKTTEDDEEEDDDNENNTSMNDDSELDEEDEEQIEKKFTVKTKKPRKSPSKATTTTSKTAPQKIQSIAKSSKPVTTKLSQQSSQTTSNKKQSSQTAAPPTPQKKKETKIKYNLKPINIERLATYDQHMSEESLSTEKIIKRLKKLDEYLQDKKRGDTDGLDTVLAVLIESKFIENKSFEVKLMTSCCLSEIFRIYAPTLPFDMVVIKIVFKLFTEQVLYSGSIDKKLFPQYFQMLERLSLIKVFALLGMVDLTMVPPFFRDCLNKVQGDKEHQPMDTMMSTLLNTILESLEEVPVQLWNELLEALIEREKGGIPTAKAIFSHDLIETNSRFLQVHFELFLQDFLEPESVAIANKDINAISISSKLKKKKNEILFEMFNILPEFIYPALPSLEFDLEDVNPSVRKGAALVLSRCYSTEGASDELIQQRSTLYTTFLNRFHDVDVKIRIIMMEFSQHFTTSSNLEMERVLKMVRDRFRDSESEIRIKAISVFQTYISKNPELMDADLMSEYLERVRDKDSQVRKDAEISLSTVWRSIREKYGPIDTWSNTLVDCFSTIPNTLIHCLGLYDDDKYRIEIALDSILLPQHSDIKNRSQVFLEIYQYLDEQNKQLFKKYFEEKKSLRQEFLALYQFLKNPKINSNTPNKKQQNQQQYENDIEVYITHVDNLLPKFIGESSKKLVRQLITPQNKKIFDLLVLISDINTTFQEQYNIKISIISKAQNESSFSEFIKYMVNKLAYSIIGKENIKYFLRSLRNELGMDNFDKNATIDLMEEFSDKVYEKEIKDGPPVAIEILLMLSQVYPSIFDDYGDQLVGFLTCSKTIVYPILQILSNCSSSLKFTKKATLKSTLDILVNLTNVPQPTIARLAFKTFIKFATPALTSTVSTSSGSGKQAAAPKVPVIDNNRLVQSLTDLTNNLFDQLEEKSKNLLSILEVIGCLAKGYSSVLLEHMDTLDILLIKKIMTGPCTLDFNQKVYLKSDHMNATTYCKDVMIKIASIKCMSNYLLGLRDITKKSHEMVNMLFDFYRGLDKNKTYSDLEKSHLKMHIAIGLFRVFQRSVYEKEISVDQFILICNSTSITTKQRGDPLIRKLIEKIAKVIRLNRLPLKYMAAFGMAAQQPYSVLALVRKLSTSIIKTRRMVISRLSASLANTKHLNEFYPESSMPYFLYVVSHRDDFERDAPDYIESACYLNFFIDLLVEEADNYSIIYTILSKLKKSTDAIDPKSKNHNIAAELGLQILTHQYQQKKWKPQKHPVVIVLPQKFYIINDENQEENVDEEVASIKLPSLLPKRFKLPPLPAITNDPNTAVEDEDADDTQTTTKKDGDAATTTTTTTTTSKPATKKVSKKPAAKPKAKTTPKKRGRKKKQESSSEEEEEESEQEDEEEEEGVEDN